jgi:tol-pal system protein YbgF
MAADLDYRLRPEDAPVSSPSPSESWQQGENSGASGAVAGAAVGAAAAAAGSPGTADGGQTLGTGPRVLGTLSRQDFESNRPNMPQSRTPEAADAGTASSAASTPRGDYARAFDLMQQRRYDEADGAFQAFLVAYPDNSLVPNARFWLGEIYYAKGDYRTAATTYLDNYEKDKTGQKAPETLLKLGLSLSKLDKTREACATFQELDRAFPDAPESVKTRSAEEKKRLGCG